MNDGISYYGIHVTTVIPYEIALVVGGSVAGILAARHVPNIGKMYRIRIGIYLFALLALGVASTPYSISDFFDNLHTGFGSLLFALQLFLTGWLALSYARRWHLITLWAGELIAGLFSAYYIVVPVGYLFLSQIAFQICFASIIIIILQNIEFDKNQPAGTHKA